MAWYTTQDGKHYNTDWVNTDNEQKEQQIAKNKQQASERNLPRRLYLSNIKPKRRIKLPTFLIYEQNKDFNLRKALKLNKFMCLQVKVVLKYLKKLINMHNDTKVQDLQVNGNIVPVLQQ